MNPPEDLSSFSLLDLFRTEVETQSAAMTAALLALERIPDATHHLEEVMRGAHSIKGAARIVGRAAAVRVAHAMEDCLVAAQMGTTTLPRERLDQLLEGVDLLVRIALVPEAELSEWERKQHAEIDGFLSSLEAPVPNSAPLQQGSDWGLKSGALSAGKGETSPPDPVVAAPRVRERESSPGEAVDVRALRVAAQSLNRLLGLAGESVVASRWLDGFLGELLRCKRQQRDLLSALASFRDSLAGLELDERLQGQLNEVKTKAEACGETLAVRLEELDSFDRRFHSLSARLYQEVLNCRMRPFADGIQGFPRMLRDTARALGKNVSLEALGTNTPVDREILERVESPLGHLLRNAVDHGVETPEERRGTGKPEEGKVTLEARHSAGMLFIEVADDGRGIDLEAMRAAVVRKGLTTHEIAGNLTTAEMLEFLFLPGFTMKEAVTEISGRGVGLDVVQTMVKEVGGSVRALSELGHGTKFQLQLPLTLSVLRTLLVDIAGEPYAFPLGRISSAVKVSRNRLQAIEGREHFTLGDQQIGLVTAHQVLGFGESHIGEGDLPVIVLGDKVTQYGVVVDRFLGERELVVRPLDPRLGKVKDVTAAALMPDQTPALIIDVDDLLRSIENLVSGGRLSHVYLGAAASSDVKRKRVLVVDDSVTVRELERKLIGSRGYEVAVAVDGMDGWNAVRTGHYDLVVTDVDMPRLDGVELVSLIKKDSRLQSTPVVIVSYKDREEDRRRGLHAGADYYLTKGSFHDETLLRAIEDLIGEPEE